MRPLIVVLLILFPFGGRDVMIMNDLSRPNPDYWAARAALAALRTDAGLTRGDTSEWFRMTPSTELLREDEVSRRLAGLPKPVSCRGTLEAGIIVIKCERMEERAVLEHHRSLAEQRADEWERDITRLCGPNKPDVFVLLESPDASMTLPLIGVRRWMLDYYVPYTLALKRVAPGSLPEGICAVLSLSRPGPARAELHLQSPERE